MSSNSRTMFSDEEWVRLRDGWKANSKAARTILRLVREDYRPGSEKHKRIGAVIKREKMEIDLILLFLDRLREIDRILHATQGEGEQVDK